jgi:hypothetical protein
MLIAGSIEVNVPLMFVAYESEAPMLEAYGLSSAIWMLYPILSGMGSPRLYALVMTVDW